jgi:hypothetical protein
MPASVSGSTRERRKMSKSGRVTRGEYSANYEVSDGMVRITSVFGSKSTQLGDSDPELLAGLMLQEQITAANLRL